jgi:hypothetical protein
VLDPRIYRAGLLPALLALIVAAFSIEQPERPLSTTLAPDSFSGARAFETLRALEREFPSRRPGSRGDDALATRVRVELRAARFRTSERRFEGRTAVGRRELRTVVGVRTGRSDRQIVVLAHRDALQRPATAQLSGTAALLELARVFRGRTLRKTLVLASTSGGSGGDAGAAELAAHLGGGVDAVIALGDMAGGRVRRPTVVPWSNAVGVAPQQLRSTVEAALRLETGMSPGLPGAFAQFSRLAFPLTVSEQGELAADGYPAVLLSVSGERGPGGARDVSVARLASFGRSALRSITALDTRSGPPPHPRAEILAARKVLPGWAVRLVVGVLILPVLVAAVDGVARARRRRHPVGMWVAWVLAGGVPFALAVGFAWLLALVGLAPTPPATAVPEGAVPLDLAAAAVLGAVALALVLGWVAVRPLVLRLWGVRGHPGSPGAASALALVLVALVSVVWVLNPFAAALLLAPLHAWVLLATPELRIRAGVALAVVAITFLPIATVVLYYALALGYGPLDVVWNGLLIAVGGHVGVLGVAAWCVLLGCLVSVVAIIRAQESFLPDGRPPDVKPSTRGPITYAGPGSLGGTESALRR